MCPAKLPAGHVFKSCFLGTFASILWKMKGRTLITNTGAGFQDATESSGPRTCKSTMVKTPEDHGDKNMPDIIVGIRNSVRWCPENYESREQINWKGRTCKRHWKHQWSINRTMSDSCRINSKRQIAIILFQNVLAYQLVVFNSKGGAAVAKGRW